MDERIATLEARLDRFDRLLDAVIISLPFFYQLRVKAILRDIDTTDERTAARQAV